MAYKVIVAHPGRQHSFRLASALKKNDMLFKYVTTVYDKDISFLMKMVKKFLPQDDVKRANSRRNSDLLDDDVVQFCEFSGLIEILLSRFDKSKKLYNWWQSKTTNDFGKKVAKLAIKEKVDAVVMYDTNAGKCFEMLKKKAPNILRIMDVSAANRVYMKKVYEEDMIRCPELANQLKNERSFLWQEKRIKYFQQENDDTEYFIVPSKFVEKSLTECGVKKEKIIVCPYGSNFDISNTQHVYSKKLPIKATYVGNVTAMKGVYYLLEAIKELSPNDMKLSLVGTYDTNNEVWNKYKNTANFVGRVLHEDVKKILQESDIFVFPSLGEGLSLSVLEALASGLPCIVTENSGANDAISNYENGFVVPVGDKNALKEKMQWFVDNKDKIEGMGKKAQEVAKKYTWKNYERNIQKEIINIIESTI